MISVLRLIETLKSDAETTARRCCLAAVGIGFLALCGWVFDVQFLKSIGPNFISMKVNTALGIIMLSGAVFLTFESSPAAAIVRKTLATLTCLLAGLTLAQYLFSWNLGIDELFFVDRDAVGGHFPPGRLAPITAVCFLLLGSAVWAASISKPLARKGGQLIGFVAFMAAFQALVGYLCGVTYSFGLAYYTQMAVHTAAALVLLSVSFLLSTRQDGLMFIMAQPTVGGRNARRLVFASIFVPPLVNWMQLKGQDLGLYDADFGTLIRVMGNVLFFFIIVWRNAADLHALEESRHAREVDFQLLTEALPQLIWAADAKGKINFFAKRWHEYTGRSLPVNLDTDAIIHPDDRVNTRETWRRSVRTGEPFRMEYRLLHRDGEYRWQLTNALPCKDSAGNIVRWFGSCTDIHDQKQEQAAREELAVRERSARESSRLKSAFLASVSHEVRTPISGVVGMTGLLLETNLGEEQRAYADAIKRSGEALLTVINDILDISKIEAGKIDFEEADFPLAQATEDAWLMLKHAAQKKGLHFEFHQDARLPAVVRGDRGRLRQVVLNLLSNAVKFTLDGTVTLKTTLLSSTPEAIWIRIDVTDTGIGISPEAKPHLFEAFFQADNSMARRFGGTGLGLSICNDLVKCMGGEIGVESQVGKGSNFWFTVQLKPAADQRVEKEGGSSKEIIKAERPARILIADDMEINKIIAVKMVEKIGHKAASVANGKEVLEALRGSSYDLVLMDCQMPEMDGYEATRLIRSDKEMPNKVIPIIAMTANAMRGEREKCLAAGMNDYISKPIDESELAIMISKWLSWRTRKNEVA